MSVCGCYVRACTEVECTYFWHIFGFTKDKSRRKQVFSYLLIRGEEALKQPKSWRLRDSPTNESMRMRGTRKSHTSWAFSNFCICIGELVGEYCCVGGCEEGEEKRGGGRRIDRDRESKWFE